MDARYHQRPLDSFKGKPCPYCGISMQRRGNLFGVSRDHIIPKKHGGELTPDNRLICCRKCNGDKASLTLQEWINRLRMNGDPRLLLVEAVKKSLELTCVAATDSGIGREMEGDNESCRGYSG